MDSKLIRYPNNYLGKKIAGRHIVICTGITFRDSVKEKIHESSYCFQMGDKFLKGNVGPAAAEMAFRNGFDVILFGKDQKTIEMFGNYLESIEYGIAGNPKVLGCYGGYFGWEKDSKWLDFIESALSGIDESYSIHLFYNNGFGDSGVDDNFRHISEVDSDSYGKAVLGFIGPFDAFLKRFESQLVSQERACLVIKTSLAAQRTMEGLGVDAVIKASMQMYMKTLRKDYHDTNILFSQVAEGTYESGFYDCNKKMSEVTTDDYLMNAAVLLQAHFSGTIQTYISKGEYPEKERKMLLEAILKVLDRFYINSSSEKELVFNSFKKRFENHRPDFPILNPLDVGLIEVDILKRNIIHGMNILLVNAQPGTKQKSRKPGKQVDSLMS